MGLSVGRSGFGQIAWSVGVRVRYRTSIHGSHGVRPSRHSSCFRFSQYELSILLTSQSQLQRERHPRAPGVNLPIIKLLSLREIVSFHTRPLYMNQILTFSNSKHISNLANGKNRPVCAALYPTQTLFPPPKPQNPSVSFASPPRPSIHLSGLKVSGSG